MPRLREFDVDETLDRAMYLFWRKGFADTSVRDLTEHTGVAHAGLYAAFRTKEGLFATALERYRDKVVDGLFGPLEKPDSGRAEIDGLFQYMVMVIKDGRFRDGCLMANTVVEFADSSGPVKTLIKEHMRRMNSAFEGAVKRGINAGTIRSDLDYKEAAALMTTTFHGLAVLVRADVPISVIEASAKGIQGYLG